ncbi:sugar transferase [Romboutsia timonensis]|uniref:sugar transferase n=1 Tax=Romboutsia timonensis TaxID=1776391 RepID=UPI002A807C39|nr:sugar transferase [Romboutsia timonensis]MDY3959731.1 sugar transferase [Romboutsia timonensis]
MNNIMKSISDKLYSLFVLFIDISFSIVGIILTLPILLVVAILIKLEDRGPIIYTQKRSGKDGKEFTIYKIRSMKLESPNELIGWTDKNDNRITNVGKVIRRTRIDELPQFINILKRDMSLIGPRPEVPELTKKFNEEINGFTNRLKVRPGLTGWAQVNGGYDLTPREKYQKDMYYIKNRGIKLDIIILFKTVKVIISGNGAR